MCNKKVLWAALILQGKKLWMVFKVLQTWLAINELNVQYTTDIWESENDM